MLIKDKSNKTMKSSSLVLAIISVLSLCAFGVTRVVCNISFNQNCSGYLKRAADANTVDLAKESLKIAIDYMEEEDLTEGYTSVIYKTPSEDVGFWYKNISSAYQELDNLSADASPLEKSNMLIKLRETLLDQGGKEEGTVVTVPKGISVYPHNTVFALWGILSLILAVIFALPILRD